MKNQPKVSVIIPVYNAEEYLRECLDSVVNQTLRDIEIICVDDGSTDSSLNILREYEEKDDRVTVLTQENINAGAARNKGLAIAKGKYLSFLDADDFFAHDMLEKSFLHAETNEAQITVFGSDRYIQSTGKYESTDKTIRAKLLPDKAIFSGKEIPKDRFKLFVGWAWDKLFLREFVAENDLKFQEQRTTNDMFFVFAALIRAERICALNDVLAHQRKNTEGTLSVTREKSWHCFYDALCKLKVQFQEWECWDWVEQDFINYAVHSSLWNLSTLQESTQRLLYQRLHGDWIFELGIADKAGEYFYNQYEYGQISKVATLSYDEFYGLESKNATPVREAVSSPKVSIIMPSLNVAEYIRECIESVINQTLEEIEIICVDAGSTDGTLEILEEYAARDRRIKVIRSDRKSYGYQMNLGVDAATGEYIGIVETDDYVKLDMYAALYDIAKHNEADLVKADFYRFIHNKGGKLELTYNQLYRNSSIYNRVIKPSDETVAFKLILNTWSGIYSRSFLLRNNIRHNETPGASYQDNGFWFKTFALAERAYFVHRPYYMNRRDNPNSSVHSRAKVYCMNEEYAYILEFLIANPELKARLMPMYCWKKYNNYVFTYNRIGEEFKLEYIVQFRKEFLQHQSDGYLDDSIFSKREWIALNTILNDPIKFYSDTTGYTLSAKNTVPQEQVNKGNEAELIHQSASYKIGRFITFVPRKLRGAYRCLRDNGIKYTFKRVLVHLRLHRIYELVRNGIYCIQDNGLRYTICRMKEKLFRKKK